LFRRREHVLPFAAAFAFISACATFPARSWRKLLRDPEQVLLVCANGLAHYEDGSWRIIRWDEIATLQPLQGLDEAFTLHHGLPPGYRAVYRLQLQDGSKFHLNNYFANYRARRPGETDGASLSLEGVGTHLIVPAGGSAHTPLPRI
jgi:hypothetical protein